MGLFIPPPAHFFEWKKSGYLDNWIKSMQEHWAGFGIKVNLTAGGGQSYTAFNYSGKGLISKIKLAHFEAVLKLTENYFHKCNVIDMGCADGIFLPSLSAYFNSIAAIDISADFAHQAKELTTCMNLSDVHVLCSENKTISEIKKELPGESWKLMFLLEVMEHVGEPERMYESKVEFLEDAFSLLEEDGLIIITVPKMVGLSFFIQRFGLSLLGLPREPISFKNFIKASFLRDASPMEKYWWNGGHMGFSHLKLEKYMQKKFKIVKKKNLVFQMLYIIRKKQEG